MTPEDYRVTPQDLKPRGRPELRLDDITFIAVVGDRLLGRGMNGAFVPSSVTPVQRGTYAGKQLGVLLYEGPEEALEKATRHASTARNVKVLGAVEPKLLARFRSETGSSAYWRGEPAVAAAAAAIRQYSRSGSTPSESDPLKPS